MNDLPLYLGGDPWTQEVCHVRMLLDEVKAYNHALTPTSVLAEVGPATALGGLADFVRFGCCSCNGTQAQSSCAAGYHVCSSLDLHTGAQQVADRLGWTRCAGGPKSLWNSHDAEHHASQNRVAVCCEDLA